jgi:deoxyribodipyrimidine photolyase
MTTYASFKSNGDLFQYGNLKKNLTEIKAIKEKDGVKVFSINEEQYTDLQDGCDASESSGVVTIIKSAEWLENKNNEAWRKIRKERNQLLKDSDYIMFPDITITTEKKEEWTTYRQSLRDIPQTFSNPDDVTYPDKPE